MNLHGISLSFANPDDMVRAARVLRSQGFRAMEAYTPYPVEEMNELLETKSSHLPAVGFICGLLGGCGGYYLQAYTEISLYAVNVGGRPLHSWPAFIPVTFELTILGAAVGIFVGFFVFTKLPRLHHPIFAPPNSDRISNDRFVLCVEASDPQFARPETRTWLASLGAEEMHDVPL